MLAFALGLYDGRREGVARGVLGMSPRNDEVDDFLIKAGELERLKLATLELRRRGLESEVDAEERRGEEGRRWRSGTLRGEFRRGDCGRGVFVAV